MLRSASSPDHQRPRRRRSVSPGRASAIQLRANNIVRKLGDLTGKFSFKQRGRAPSTPNTVNTLTTNTTNNNNAANNNQLNVNNNPYRATRSMEILRKPFMSQTRLLPNEDPASSSPGTSSFGTSTHSLHHHDRSASRDSGAPSPSSKHAFTPTATSPGRPPHPTTPPRDTHKTVNGKWDTSGADAGIARRGSADLGSRGSRGSRNSVEEGWVLATHDHHDMPDILVSTPGRTTTTAVASGPSPGPGPHSPTLTPPSSWKNNTGRRSGEGRRESFDRNIGGNGNDMGHSKHLQQQQHPAATISTKTTNMGSSQSTHGVSASTSTSAVSSSTTTKPSSTSSIKHPESASSGSSGTLPPRPLLSALSFINQNATAIAGAQGLPNPTSPSTSAALMKKLPPLTTTSPTKDGVPRRGPPLRLSTLPALTPAHLASLNMSSSSDYASQDQRARLSPSIISRPPPLPILNLPTLPPPTPRAGPSSSPFASFASATGAGNINANKGAGASNITNNTNTNNNNNMAATTRQKAARLNSMPLLSRDGQEERGTENDPDHENTAIDDEEDEDMDMDMEDGEEYDDAEEYHDLEPDHDRNRASEAMRAGAPSPGSDDESADVGHGRATPRTSIDQRTHGHGQRKAGLDDVQIPRSDFGLFASGFGFGGPSASMSSRIAPGPTPTSSAIHLATNAAHIANANANSAAGRKTTSSTSAASIPAASAVAVASGFSSASASAGGGELEDAISTPRASPRRDYFSNAGPGSGPSSALQTPKAREHLQLPHTHKQQPGDASASIRSSAQFIPVAPLPSPLRPNLYHQASKSMVDLLSMHKDTKITDLLDSDSGLGMGSEGRGRGGVSDAKGKGKDIGGGDKPTSDGAAVALQKEKAADATAAAARTGAGPEKIDTSITGVGAGAVGAKDLPATPTLRRRRSMPTFSMHGPPPPYPTFFANHHGHHGALFAPAPREEEGREALPDYSNDVLLVAIMPRKLEFTMPGVQARDRKWRRVLCVLEGTAFRVYACPSRVAGVSVLGEWWEKKVGVGDVSLVGGNLGTVVTGASASAAAEAARRDANRGLKWEEEERRSIDVAVAKNREQMQAAEQLRQGGDSQSQGNGPSQSQSQSQSQNHGTGSGGQDERPGTPHGAQSRMKKQLAASLLHPSRVHHVSSSSSSSSQRGPSPVPTTPRSSIQLSRPSSRQSGASAPLSTSSSAITPSSSVRSQTSSASGPTPSGSANATANPTHSHSRSTSVITIPDPSPKDLLRAYTMQNAESGLASDYTKRKNVIRVRMEGEQFLLQAVDIADVVEWIEGLQAAANIALDLDDRAMPKGPIFPRRRRRRRPRPVEETPAAAAAAPTPSSAPTATAAS